MPKSLGIVLVLLLTAAIDLPSIGHDFVYEDPAVITAAHTSGAVRWLGANRPVTAWTLRSDSARGGSPWMYHETNLLLHLTTGASVAILASQVAADPIVAAVVFLLHPIQTEAVAYVNARSELIAALGIVLACVLWGYRTWPCALVGLGWLLLALGAKETAFMGLVLVPLVIAYDRPRLAASWIPASVAILSCGLFLLPDFQQYARSTHAAWGWRWAVLQATAAWRYVALTIWPTGFTVDHDIESVPVTLQVACAALWAIVPVVAVAVWRRSRTIAIALLWVWLAVLPRLAFPIPSAPLSEHQWYLPMVGLSLLAGRLWTETRRV